MNNQKKAKIHSLTWLKRQKVEALVKLVRQCLREDQVQAQARNHQKDSVLPFEGLRVGAGKKYY
jgi:hypothetical protein